MCGERISVGGKALFEEIGDRRHLSDQRVCVSARHSCAAFVTQNRCNGYHACTEHGSRKSCSGEQVPPSRLPRLPIAKRSYYLRHYSSGLTFPRRPPQRLPGSVPARGSAAACGRSPQHHTRPRKLMQAVSPLPCMPLDSSFSSPGRSCPSLPLFWPGPGRKEKRKTNAQKMTFFEQDKGTAEG